MYKKTILATVILILSTLYLHAQNTLETTLTWKVGKDTVIFNESVTETATGYVAVLNTSVGELDRQLMDKQRSVIEWQRQDAREDTDMLAIRQGSKVTLKGTYKGKPYEKDYDFGNLPWYQLHEASYEELYRSGLAKANFMTFDRRTMKLTEFKAEMQEEESILIMGKQIPAVKYSLGVSGVPAFLFQAHFWLRKGDGHFLKLEVPAILGLPKSAVELTGERSF
ncbi:hypothetical protein MASR2M78_19260 [Treponema sp.]